MLMLLLLLLLLLLRRKYRFVHHAHTPTPPPTCGIIFFSCSSLNSGAGGRSRVSSEKGTCVSTGADTSTPRLMRRVMSFMPPLKGGEEGERKCVCACVCMCDCTYVLRCAAPPEGASDDAVVVAFAAPESQVQILEKPVRAGRGGGVGGG